MHRPRSSRRALRLAGGFVFSTAVFLTLGESAARLFNVVDRVNGIPRRFYIATDVPDLPYRLRPGFRMTEPVPLRINDHGLRGPQVTDTPRPGYERILVLGDSVVFGWGQMEDATFSARLQAELERRGQRQTEVLNGGVPGYNTAAELAFFRSYGLALEPERVVLGVSFNDLGDTPVLTAHGLLTSRTTSHARANWLNDHSEFYTLLRWLIVYAGEGHWFQRIRREAPAADPSRRKEALAAFDDAIARRHQQMYRKPGGAGWKRIRSSLRALGEATRGHGIALTVVIFPEKFQFGTDEPNLDPQRAWLRLCAEFSLDCVDLWAAFASDGTQSLFADTQHPNAAGLAIAARAVAERLTQ